MKVMTKRKKPTESVNGSYTAVPHAVLDSAAFKGASYTAKALLFEVIRQHSGGNNGHLQLYTEWLYKRCWKSAGTIQKAKEELIERGLIVKTRWGGLNFGADRFALTWLDISNFSGLDIRPSEYHKGAWTFMDKLPFAEKRKACSEIKNSSVPEFGTALLSSVPKIGTEEAISVPDPVPESGNNECLPSPTHKTFRRVVGRKGRSGIPRGLHDIG
jgi:hypothetical protein